MPIYEYECKKCKTVFETIVSASSRDDDVKCEKCGSDEVNKLISATAIKISTGAPLSQSSNCQSRGGFK